MTDVNNPRWQRLFGALVGGDDEVARQQLEILTLESPDDLRRFDAESLLLARSGRPRAAVRALLAAAGLESSSLNSSSPATAESTIARLTDPPDRLRIAAVGGTARHATCFLGGTLADADWQDVAASQLGFLQVELRRLRAAGASLDHTAWEQSAWRGADFSRGRAATSQWHTCSWAGVIANAADLSGARFDRHVFDTCQLMNTSFDRAVFSRSEFRSCELLGASFAGALMIGVSFRPAGASLAPLGHVDFRGAWLIDCDLSGADLEGAAWEGAVLLRTSFDPGFLPAIAQARVVAATGGPHGRSGG